MASSGIFSKNVGNGWRLQVEWSSSQSTANNESTITAKLYWMSLGSAYSVYSSATKNGYISINGGATSTFSGGGLASLSGNQKKLLHTFTKDVGHDSDGTKSLTITGMFDADVALSGASSTSDITTSDSVTLTTIPRQSTLTDSSPNWTAGSNITFGINRHSTAYHHEIEIYLAHSTGTSEMPDGTKCTHLKQLVLTNSETSKSSSFSVAEKLEIFQRINQGSSVKAWVRLQTFTGSARTVYVGTTQEYYATVTSPSSSTTASSMTKDIDESVTINLSRANSEFTHTLRFYVGTTLIHTSSARSVETSYTWNPTTAETNNMLNATPNSKTISSKVEVDTFYSTEQVKAKTTKTGTFTVVDASPTFGTGYTYKDKNTVTSTITSNNLYIIQDHSTVEVTIPTTAFAVAQKYATMSKYEVSLNGTTKSATHGASNIVLDFGTIDAGTNQTLSIKAIDSRGFYKTTTKTVIVLAYKSPVTSVSATRLNGFEDTITVKLKGSISALTTTSQRNALTSISGQTAPLQYRYKENVTSGVYGSWMNFVYSTLTNTYTATDITVVLNNTKSYIFEVRATDKLSTTTFTAKVATGKPILFVDSIKKSVGVGKFPKNDGTFEVDGDIRIGYPPSYGEGNQGKIIWDGDPAQGVQLSVNTYDNKRAPFGIHLERSAENTQTNYEPYFAVDGDIFQRNNKVIDESRFVVGYAVITPVANTPTSLWVNFGKTFSKVPSAFVTANTTVPNTVSSVSYSGATTTGMYVWVLRSNTTGTGISWMASDMP